MSTAAEPVVAPTKPSAELSSEPAAPVPSIQYLVTMWVDSKGKYSPSKTDVAIHDVVRVVEGSLSDALPLLAYRNTDVFSLLTANGVLRKTEFVESKLADRPKMIFGSFVVAHEDTLYGVVVKDSVAQVVGPIRHVVTSIDQTKTENCLVLGKAGPVSLPYLVDSRKVVFDPESHILVVLPLGGYCFVQFSETSDESGDEDTDREPNPPGLVLLMGVSFLLLENMSLKWNRFKSIEEKEMAPWSLAPGESLFMYGGGCVLEDGVYTIHGHGPRPSTYTEAYYYALMHVGSSFVQKKASS